MNGTGAGVTETAKRRLAFQKAFSQEHGGWRKKSLIADAKFETAANKEFQRHERRVSVTKSDSIGDQEGFDPGLLPDAFPDDYVAFNVLLSLREGAVSLAKVIRLFEWLLLLWDVLSNDITPQRLRYSGVQYAATIDRSFDVTYDPYTQSVKVLDHNSALSQVASGLQTDVDTLVHVMNRFNRPV
ncbi:uncharacterized protein LOC101845659 [Aplysia californica]|uniref:Uncharacterized protein LOC101845659 n=1 Tax=Aplysia californica TaxID=6500 RepID=A0ABM1VQA5_APLCA|nr:uncharacterized protein LOC101845659 [Aplysia californica]